MPGALSEAGLEEIGGEVHTPLWHGGGDADFFGLTIRQLRGPMVRTELVTDQDVDRILELSAHPSWRHVPFVRVTAWGRQPAG